MPPEGRGRLPFNSSTLLSYQNILTVVSTDTVSATSFTSSTLRKLIEKFTLGVNNINKISITF